MEPKNLVQANCINFSFHCPAERNFTAENLFLMQFWSPAASNSAHICSGPTKASRMQFLRLRCCNFRDGKTRSSAQANGAKNEMNNFKVRVIKQQWGIIKHQASPHTGIPSIAIPNRSQYSLRYWTIFQQFKTFLLRCPGSVSRFTVELASFFRYFFHRRVARSSVAGAWERVGRALTDWRGFQIKNASYWCTKTATRER